MGLVPLQEALASPKLKVRDRGQQRVLTLPTLPTSYPPLPPPCVWLEGSGGVGCEDPGQPHSGSYPGERSDGCEAFDQVSIAGDGSLPFPCNGLLPSGLTMRNEGVWVEAEQEE